MAGADITLPAHGAAPETPAYAALTPNARRGMVIVHEAYGPQPEINRVVDRFAAHGYAAVAPEIFKSLASLACIRKVVEAMQTGQGEVVDRIRGAGEWLCAKASLQPSQVGLTGFCMGGGFVLVAGSGWGAVSTNYGDVPPTELMRGIGPVIGCYGGRDLLFGQNAEKLKARLAPLGITPETHTYPQIGHSFLTDGHHPVGSRLSYPLLRITYDKATAEEGWTQILAFMDRHLVANTLH